MTKYLDPAELFADDEVTVTVVRHGADEHAADHTAPHLDDTTIDQPDQEGDR